MDSLDLTRIVEAAAIVILALIGFFAVRPMAGRLLSPQVAAGPEPTEGIAGPTDVPQLTGPSTAPAAVEGGGGEPALAQSGNAAGVPALAGPQQAPSGVAQAIDIAQIEGQVKESSIKKVGELVTSHPEESLSILRTWLHESA